MFLLLRCLHNAEEMWGFDRPRQTLLFSIITDCGGELSWFCQLAAPTVWWLLRGTADIVKVLDIPLGWRGVTNDVHKDGRNYVPQSFVVSHKPGKCAVSTRSYQRPVARKSKPRRSPALWAVVTNDLCIRRCRLQSNNVTPVNISD